MRIELITEIAGKKAIGLSGIKALADKGDATALNLLGEWLIMGFECSPDSSYAVSCFEKAARMGNTQAMLNLGICYIEGHGVKKDFYAAERWIRAADELGDPEAKQVCEELYLTTIGDHKASIRALVDYLYTKFPKGDVYHDEKAIKKEIIDCFILESAGKTEEEIEQLKGKVTENDIAAYESMNDIYLNSNDEASTKIAPAEYCSFLETQVGERDRLDLIQILKVLYYLSGKKNKSLQSEICVLAEECADQGLCKEPLSWWEKAQYDVPDYLIGKIDTPLFSHCLELIQASLHKIEEDELSALYASKCTSRTELAAERSNIKRSSLYCTEIRDSWIAKFTAKICELEEAELSQRLKSINGAYDLLVSLHNDLSTGTYEPETKKKWLSKIKEEAIAAQERALASLCSKLSTMSYEDLKNTYQFIRQKFTFSADVQKKYLLLVEQPIDTFEISKLEKLCEKIDDLSSTQYSDLLQTIEGLNFKASNTKKYIDSISDKLKNAMVLESCEVEKLESYDLDQLNDRVRAIHFSTLSPDIKKSLSQRVTQYIDLIYDCKDKATLHLLDQCEPSQIVNLSLFDLRALKDAIDRHQRLEADRKAELLAQITQRITVVSFQEDIARAGTDYDSLMDLLNKVDGKKLPDDARIQFRTILISKVLEAQKIALKTLTTFGEQDQHSHIIKRIERARHYSYDTSLRDEAIAKINLKRDEIEIKTLDDMCSNLANKTYEELDELAKKVKKLGFKKENTSSYLNNIEDRKCAIEFDKLAVLCTASNLTDSRFSLHDCEDLYANLNNLSETTLPVAPYLERVDALLKIKKAHNDAILELYLGDIPTIRDYVATVVKGEPSSLFIFGNKLDSSATHWKKRLLSIEKPVFIYDSKSTQDPLKYGVCITNMHVYIAESDTAVHTIRIETIQDIKPAKIFDTISIITNTGKYSFSAFSGYEGRVMQTNILVRIINHLVPIYKQKLQEYRDLDAVYAKAYADCFQAHPIPTEKPAMKKEETEETSADSAASSVESKEQLNKENSNPSISPAQLSIPEMVSACGMLIQKHMLSSRFLAYGTPEYTKKIDKAKQAYAYTQGDEIAFFMEDPTLFGSAKEGFVVTNRSIYIKLGSTNGKVSLERIKAVFVTYNASYKMFKLCLQVDGLDTTNGDLYITTFSSIDLARHMGPFWCEVFTLLGYSVVDTTQVDLFDSLTVNSTNAQHSVPVSTTTASTSPASQPGSSMWMCTCGTTNKGKFCVKCGSKKESGTPLWTCSCGNLNKGKFCSKCGSPRKE